MTLLACVLVPVDVFLISYMKNPDGENLVHYFQNLTILLMQEYRNIIIPIPSFCAYLTLPCLLIMSGPTG